jgi:prephenate dehydratase
MTIRVGIQGGKASFHEEAAKKILAEKTHEIVECQTFAALAQSLADGEIDLAVMAIENTIAGNLLPNYSLIQRFDFQIMAETVLDIRLHLMAMEEQPIEQLSVIRSHPVALLQCHEFLAKYPTVPTQNAYDTADGARLARENNEIHTGIIAGPLAAKRYNMHILAKNIQSAGNNQTRFFLLSKKDIQEAKKNSTSNKASICFQLHHHVGSLADVLMNCKYHQVNLTKILSLPIVGKTDEYNFYVDLTWQNNEQFKALKSLLKQQVKSLQVLGMYTNVSFSTAL